MRSRGEQTEIDRGGLGVGKEMEDTSRKLIEKDDVGRIKPVARYAKVAVEITCSEKIGRLLPRESIPSISN